MNSMSNQFDLSVLLPEIFLLSMVVLILLNDCFSSKDNPNASMQRSYIFSLVSLFGAILLIGFNYGQFAGKLFWDGQIAGNTYIDLLKMFAMGTVGVGFIYSRRSLIHGGLYKAEFYILALLGTLGMLVLISAASLLALYLGLELMSLSMYAMVAFNKHSTKSSEAAMKYFVMGSMASGVLLYGMALIYGATGSITLIHIGQVIPEILLGDIANKAILLVGIVFLVAGIAFKFGAVPYHSWVPDVYEGAPNSVVLYISTAPKLAAAAMAYALLYQAAGSMLADWSKMLAVLCVLSFAVGNLVALMQTNIKRLLGYSAISHVGFILLGFATKNVEGSIFYTITYALTSLAAFGILLGLEKNGKEIDQVSDLKGLNQNHPWFAFLMLCVLASLAGIPPLVGFTAKFSILVEAYKAGMLPVVLIGLIFSVIGLFYYLRIVKVMYFDEPDHNSVTLSSGTLSRTLLSINGLCLIAFGVFPFLLISLIS